ncbi:UNVERIFIED_CONTAM: Retrovirus-related Pol polyprotein from transposon RE1 [Sesamum radiatum]|uniref:Retrovirus-related Pol polyprotein from transposon RE1 n=1 Tax=Sesamum radiatum TaxID=300843 RepID=A0AAW2L0L0_SESRA
MASSSEMISSIVREGCIISSSFGALWFITFQFPNDGSNFLAWSRSVYISLGTKLKLGLIDSSFPMPAASSKNFEQWRRVDLMVTSWIWNSISKDVVEAFMYALSSRELWLELQRRYGRSNRPMIYQLQWEISTVTQGDISVTAYFTKLKKLWNEITCLAHSPKCTCGKCVCDLSKAISVRNDTTQIMQFLMGLHEVYDSDRSQVLMMDPLLDIEKAFAMFLSVEKQRSSTNVTSLDNITSMMAEILKLVKEQHIPTDPLTSNYANYAHFDDEFADVAKYPEWRDAMTNELQALEQNRTWKLSPLPHDKKATSCKWIFKTRMRADGSVERYKARLVAKGYNQIEGIDYNASFSPVAKVVTVRVFLTIAAARAWPIQQLDINNAFLHGYLDEDIYMLSPEGYHNEPGLVCKLEGSLYGPSLSDIQNVKVYLHDLFSIKDLGDARYFLGLEIARNSSSTYLAQMKYTLDIIKDTGLQHSKSVSIPFPSDLKLTANSGTRLQHPDIFRRLVGPLLYLGFTKPDISHSVQQLSQFLNHPCEGHLSAALHVVRYLKGCPSQGFFLPTSNNFELSVFSDADWASFKHSRRSLTEFCVFLGSAFVSWKTKKQSTVSRSTTEAKYRSMAATVGELRWISYLLTDFGVNVHTPVPLYCDNKAALHIMANPVFHERTKHIEIDCHIVRNAYSLVLPSHVKGSEQLTDIFTKSLHSNTSLWSPSWDLSLLLLVPLVGGLLNIHMLMQQLLKIMFLHPPQTQTQTLFFI